MDIATIFVILFMGILVFMLVITTRGGKSKLYCRICEREDWRKWEAVIRDFDTTEFKGHHAYGNNPSIDCYAFDIVVDGVKYLLYYWENEGVVSMHGGLFKQGKCLSDFDQYHQKVVKKMLCEKFDFMKEVIGNE